MLCSSSMEYGERAKMPTRRARSSDVSVSRNSPDIASQTGLRCSRSCRADFMANRVALTRWCLVRAQQLFLRVMHRDGHDWFFDWNIPATRDHPEITQVPALIRFERRDPGCVVGNDGPDPLQPVSPPFWLRVGEFDVENARALPVLPPPGRRVEAPELILKPPLSKVRRNRTVELLRQAALGNPDLATGFEQPRDLTEVTIIRAVVDKRIDGNDGIEELRGERQFRASA